MDAFLSRKISNMNVPEKNAPDDSDGLPYSVIGGDSTATVTNIGCFEFGLLHTEV